MTQQLNNGGVAPQSQALLNQPPLTRQPPANGVSANALAAGQGNVQKVDKPYTGLKLILRHPVTFEGVKYESITFRELILEDAAFLEDNGDNMETMIEIWSRMTFSKVPAEFFKQLPVQEVAIIKSFFMECFQGFAKED